MSEEKREKLILQGARDLLSDPTHWIKGDYAHNKTGDAVSSTSEEAICWCAEGALRVADRKTREHIISGMPFDHAPAKAYETLCKSIPEGACLSVVSYNDYPNVTHEDVLAWFDRAIKSI